MLEQVDRLPDLQQRLHQSQSQGRLPAGQGAARRPRSEQAVLAREAARAAERDGAARAQGRRTESTGAATSTRAWKRWRVARPTRPWRPWSGAEQDALHGGAGARRQGAARRARERPSRRPARERARAGSAAGRATRATSRRARGCSPGTRQERQPQGRPRPQRLRANPFDVGVEGRVAAGPQGRHRYQHAADAAPTCRRACSISGVLGSTGR